MEGDAEGVERRGGDNEVDERTPVRRNSGAVRIPEGDDRRVHDGDCAGGRDHGSDVGASRCEVERGIDGGGEPEDDEREPVDSFRGHARNCSTSDMSIPVGTAPSGALNRLEP